MNSFKRLFILTGDHSGNMHGAEVARALKKLLPEVLIAGVGGLEMAEAGVSLVYNHTQGSQIMGQVGAGGLAKAPQHFLLAQQILGFLSTFQPDAVLLIDYGGFNLWMAGRLKKRGYRVFYYILPQVWGSRRGRIRKIKQTIERAFCIFPFEESLYEQAGVPVTYVGHPLMSQLPPAVDKATFFAQHGLDATQKLIALLPGSRKLELGYLLEPMLKSIPLLQQVYPQAQFVLSQAASLPDALFQDALDTICRSMGLQSLSELKVFVLKQQTHALLSAADAGLLCSGTATLEAALYGLPMVIAYKLPPWVAFIARRIAYMKCLGLPNILTDQDNPIAPECLQEDLSPEQLAKNLLPLLDSDTEAYRRAMQGYQQIQEILAPPVPGASAAMQVAKGLVQAVLS